ncbi:MAG: ubiquitin-like protein Pup [Actinobacteria bacterium]|nr:ubiquitin-like protein Pup [Actinomycetota bacterium]
MSEQNFESVKSAPTDTDDNVSTGQSKQPKQVIVPDISAILDQIDAVLEKNSEEFVSGFVQKGGQ